MKEEFLPLVVNKNTTNHRFELTVDGYIAFIDYKEDSQRIHLMHTESPEELAGRGVATALIEKTLLYVEEHKKTLMPFCPLVFAYIKKHPEWKRIVDVDFPAFDKL
ncbi:N-acetyltransferase [Myroides sp. 1354]|uniref:GNAT family N-acetyltransferase n=1 Tax=unclassified Myroides TaxID=2642485 RepID=UPI0025785E4D|nr:MULTISPECIES: GNAT family N-acetyltransferase [unclassified Myroides]MDM1045717.1 N-acetyltransferase [Myroides sp. R163-1]MDM1056719.1 N-acetyltransferase [Myroides sp. 1354]MDM1070511.1 N-acetyltransferase [Myroides sp. 1372]